jgi:hypothetical protein
LYLWRKHPTGARCTAVVRRLRRKIIFTQTGQVEVKLRKEYLVSGYDTRITSSYNPRKMIHRCKKNIKCTSFLLLS